MLLLMLSSSAPEEDLVSYSFNFLQVVLKQGPPFVLFQPFFIEPLNSFLGPDSRLFLTIEVLDYKGQFLTKVHSRFCIKSTVYRCSPFLSFIHILAKKKLYWFGLLTKKISTNGGYPLMLKSGVA